METPVCEESVNFRSGSLTLSGVLSYPEQTAPQYAVLLCAPHPNFAGNMENNVILALARDFARNAMTLRFDYRGVGASEIQLPGDLSVFDYWSETEDSQNYAAPLEDVCAAAQALDKFSSGLPLAIVGYSFGAIVGLLAGKSAGEARVFVGIAPPLKRYSFAFLSECRAPCLLLSGRDDFVFADTADGAAPNAWAECVMQRVLDGHDHFFRGAEEIVCGHVRGFVEAAMKEFNGTTK